MTAVARPAADPRREARLMAAFVVSAIAVYAAVFVIARSVAYGRHGALVPAAALSDLLVSVPLLFYLLVVWPRGLSPLSVLPAVGVGATASKLLLPHAGSAGHVLALCVAPVEAALMVFAGLRLRRYYGGLRDNRATGVPFRDALRAALGSAPAADALYAEFAVVRYGLLWWWRRPPAPSVERGEFSYTEAGGWGALAGVLGALTLVEAPVLHVFAARWSEPAAWLLTASSLYAVLWLWADRNAVRMRPVVLTEDTLRVRAGMRWEADIPLAAVAKVQSVGAGGYRRDRKNDLEIAPGGGDARVLVVLREPLTATGPYGVRKRFRRVAVAVDDPEAFLAALLSRLGYLSGGGGAPLATATASSAESAAPAETAAV
jgi:hypothetical protein